ncbi:MAG: PorT family protein [Bacteroidales bacterium]|jgi:hypothetical protein|nr:PorT family protein [Bacteroidales bacterium]
MKKVIIYVAAFLFAATTAVGQGTYTATQEIKGEIRTISVDCIKRTILTRGDANSIRVSSSDKKVLDSSYICKITDDKLTLRHSTSNNDITVIITLKDDISRLEVFNGEVVVKGAINNPYFDLEVGTASDVALKEVKADVVTIRTAPFSILVIDKLNIASNFEFNPNDNCTIAIKDFNCSGDIVFLHAPESANIIVNGHSWNDYFNNLRKNVVSTTSQNDENISDQEAERREKLWEKQEKRLERAEERAERAAEKREKRLEKLEDERERILEEAADNDYRGDNNFSSHSVSAGIGISFLTASNNPNNFSELFNQGNTSLAIEGGTRWHFELYAVLPMTKHFAFNVGLGFEFNWFSFEKDLVAYPDGDNYRLLSPFYTGNLNNYESNLYAHYLTLPLIFEWKPTKNFGINFGVIGGLKIYSAFKTYYECDNIETDKYFTDYNNINPLKADLQLGLSYKYFNVNFRYALVPIFKAGREEIVYPFSVGLSFGL